MAAMKERFHRFFQPTDAQFQSMWQTGIFSFDASALLNIYRYSEQTSRAILDFIVKQAAQMRLPHQFAVEFCHNRPKVIVTQAIKYEAAIKRFKEIEGDLNSNKEHPHLTIEAKCAIELIKSELVAGQKRMESLISKDDYARTPHHPSVLCYDGLTD